MLYYITVTLLCPAWSSCARTPHIVDRYDRVHQLIAFIL